MQISRQKSLEANLAIATGLLVLYYFWRNEYLLLAAILFSLIGLLIPSLAKYIATAWYKLAEVLGRINGTILLTVIFFLLLTPLALIRKWIGGSVIKKKQDATKDSYFLERNHEFTSADLKNPW